MNVEDFARQHGIALHDSVTPAMRALPVKWNARLKSTAGVAQFKRTPVPLPQGGFVVRRLPVAVQLNPRLKANPDALRNTFLHEIAHVVVGKTFGGWHGPLWRRTALAFGCNGQTSHSIPEICNALPVAIVCEHCGEIGRRARMPKARRTHVEALFGVAAVRRTHIRCGGTVKFVRRGAE